jgi:excinuclease ABC subunit A
LKFLRFYSNYLGEINDKIIRTSVRVILIRQLHLMKKIQNYYRTHSPITDPGSLAYLYNNLPDKIPELIEMIQGLMIHRLAVEKFGVILTRESRKEQNLRTMEQRLERMIELDPSPLTTAREAKERQVGMCRDFAVFLTSLLRHKNIPARMRVGFAEYLNPDSIYKGDHLITEYWDLDKNKWLLVDPNVMIYDIQRDIDFYMAGSAWILSRSGKIRSDLFSYSGRWKGFPCIRGNLLHDFQALNKLELRLFDYWDELSTKAESAMTIDDKAQLDQIAELSIEPDRNFDAIQEKFQEMPRNHRIYAKLRMLGVLDDLKVVKADAFKSSGMERLVEISGADPIISERPPTLNPRFSEPTEDIFPADHPSKIHHSATSKGVDDIIVRGARQHNLKNINVRIPRYKFVVITGVSGSGKSSLAFDTIYAEGQRRYVESLSSFARQFMDQMEKPKVDQITGLSPAIAIEQKTVSRNPRSTVGTVTEILDYLRVLYARVGTPHCPQCGRAVVPQSAQQISNQLTQLPPGSGINL